MNRPDEKIPIRYATRADIPRIRELVFMHGPNAWNYLPEDEVTRHLEALGSGGTEGVLAFDGDTLAGALTFTLANPLVAYEPPGSDLSESGYIAEGVVAGPYAGQGLGTRLLVAACERLRELGARRIYAKRHEENIASAGILRKAGFMEVETFDDPERRPHGSRRTTVARLDVVDRG